MKTRSYMAGWNNWVRWIGAMLQCLSCTGLLASSSQSADYAIAHQVLESGGGRSTSAAYEVESSIGQLSGTSRSLDTIYIVRWGNAAQINRPPMIAETLLALPEDESLQFELEVSDKESDPLTYWILELP